MSAFDSGPSSRSNRVVLVLSLIVFIGLVAGAWYLWPRFERETPQIRLSTEADVLGVAPIEIVVRDGGAGLKAVTVVLESGGSEQTLTADQHAQPVPEQKIAISITKLKGVKEGPAILRVTARDASWWSWFKGNEAVYQKGFTIDVTPPSIELVADDRYVSFGGVGAIVYKPSADTATSGVSIGKHFFPGYPGQIQGNPEHHFVLFAHPYDTPADARAVLVATDKAGNMRELRLVYELRSVSYKKSTLKISDGFIESKVRPLVTEVSSKQASPRDVFVLVNRDMRKANDDKIASITSKGTPKRLWQGAFSQLSNSKVEANFADARSYDYNGEIISNAYHLGFDLSVTRHYPVEAANSGTVAFTGDLGIYGNTVIVDHGLGLFTLYSHLSSIAVREGDAAPQRHVLGKTGETGLAAGDHLHYGVYLNGVPVLPIEWWDAKWINDNITPKLDGHSGEAIHKAQESERPRKAGRRKRR